MNMSAEKRNLNQIAAQLVFCLALVVTGNAGVQADELLLKDGSRLLGKVVKKEDGTLEFETTFAGVVKVRWDAVSELRTEEPLKVMLDDETILAAGAIRKTEESKHGAGDRSRHAGAECCTGNSCLYQS